MLEEEYIHGSSVDSEGSKTSSMIRELAPPPALAPDLEDSQPPAADESPELASATLLSDSELVSQPTAAPIPRRGSPLPPSTRRARAARAQQERLQLLIDRATQQPLTRLGLRDFRGLDLRGLNLGRCDLSGADLENVDFGSTELDGASFRNSRLRHAKLDETHGLVATALAGADLAGARLPASVAKFELLSSVTAAASNCGTLLWALLGACAYSLLIVSTTSDAAIAADTGRALLPVLGSEVPSRLFLVVAPVLLALMFAYFQLCLHRLWEGCAALPAVFPGGHTLDEKIPWPLLGLLRPHLPLVRARPHALGAFQRLIGLGVIYGAVPVTLYAVWARAASLRAPWIAAVHALTLVLCCVAAYLFHRYLAHSFDARPVRVRGALALSVVLLAVLTPPSLLHKEWPLPGYTASLRRFRGAAMDNADLAGVNAQAADFTRASLRHANLDAANLGQATFRNAALIRSTFRQANLSQADLREGDLRGANFDGANLKGARALGSNFSAAYLRDAKLNGADLQNAYFCGAILSHADLGQARLAGANLSGANLLAAVGLSSEQLSRACGDQDTKLPAALAVPPCEESDACRDVGLSQDD